MTGGQRRTFLVLILLLAIIAAIAVMYLVYTKQNADRAGVGMGAAGIHGQAIFSDGQYGFTLQYPEADPVAYDFSGEHAMPLSWRVGALPTVLGTPIIALSFKSSSTSPARAVMRIGASDAPKELVRCTTADTAQEVANGQTMLGSTTFETFAFTHAGPNGTLSGMSYRTIHNGSCIAVEELDPTSQSRNVPAFDTIIHTFRFVQP